jgi:hypothetical protein
MTYVVHPEITTDYEQIFGDYFGYFIDGKRGQNYFKSWHWEI